MRRLVDPAVLVFIAALLVSLAVHLPLYEVLGVLRDRLFSHDAIASRDEAAASEDVEMAIEYEAPPTDEPVAAPSRPNERARRAPEAQARPRPAPEPPPPVVTPPPPTPPPPQQQQAEPEHPITQRSQDPNVEPPPDARFAAEENNRVDEETVARERSMTQDDPEPSPAPSHDAPSEAQEDPGEEEETEVAQTDDHEGAERGQAAAREASPAQPSAQEAAGDDGQDDRARDEAREASSSSGPTPREGGGEPEAYETITVNDGSGSFVVRRPRRRGSGAGASGGVAVTGPGGHSRAVDEDLGLRRPSSGRRGPPNLHIGYAQLESIVGRQALEDERQAYLERRRSRRRGPDHAESWRRFRAAIENFVPNVRTGNQTALNARASPFAAYTAEMHRRLHEPFHDFLAGVGSSGPLSDPTLETKLEIVLNRDGTIFQVGVVHASGQILFDHGAWAAVYAGQPYPTAPDAILSGDGRVYVRWTFKSIEPYCHVIQSERYILDNGPGSDSPAPSAPDRATPLPALPTSTAPLRLRAARPR